MYKTVILLIALVAVSSLPLTKKQHMDVLAQINTHPLGEAILSQLSLHMSAQGYLGDLVTMIEGLMSELADSQAAADGIHAQERALCDRLIPEYGNKRDANQRLAETCDKTVVDTRALLADAEEQLRQTEAELASVNGRIAEGTEQRNHEHETWTALDTEHANGVQACQDAVNLVSSLSRGSLFIQLQGRIKQVTKRLEEMTHLNDKFTAYAPLINSFAQIASTSQNPELLAQITSLLTTLKNQIGATRSADAGWEERKAAAWAKELNDLTVQKEALTTRRNNLNSQIANYHQVITLNLSNAAQAREEVEKYTYLLAQETQRCAVEQRLFDAATRGRDQEREILGKLRDYINERVGLAEEFIMMKQTESDI